MRAELRANFVLVLGTVLAAALSGFAPAALAQDPSANHPGAHMAGSHEPDSRHAGARHAQIAHEPQGRRAAHLRGHFRTAYSALQCVPYARAQSGIIIKGNAANWWDAAAGVYARGSRPEPGAVLNFRSTGHMRLGHVAVVTNVLSTREIEIDHANWTHFAATRGNVDLAMRVIDVSPANDWTAVRVELGHSGQFGAVYPTYGFIYDRPDNGRMIANTLVTLHPTQERPALDADEVAEAPALHPLGAAALPVDAPGRSLR